MTKSFIEQELGVDLNVNVHGTKILLKAITLPEKTKNGLVLPEAMRNMESRSHNIGLVLKIGKQAFQPVESFGGSPFCKVGEWVHYSSYERDPININNHICYYINDDRILSTIPEEDLVKMIPELERYK